MKRVILFFLIVLISFLTGAGSVFLWMKLNLVGEPRPMIEDVRPILAYCELANNPDKYDGQIVRVSARLIQHMHGLKFMNPNCESEEKEAVVTWSDDKDEEISNQIAQETGSEKFIYWGMPEIIAQGRFSKIKPTRKSDAMIDNAYLKFEIYSVESAAKSQ